MDKQELQSWFRTVRETLETAYLAAEEPWRQSGFSGPAQRWEACRRPIAECVRTGGAFLDIGCANGYLLECLLRWTGERGTRIDPWGLDLSERLVSLARKRLPDLAPRLLVGNGLFWRPPKRFDCVRTELCYVPDEYQWQYVRRLLQEFLLPGGRLLIAEYRSRRDDSARPWVDEALREAGFTVEFTESGFWGGKELTRVAAVPAGARNDA